jgi:hypothetical protein
MEDQSPKTSELAEESTRLIQSKKTWLKRVGWVGFFFFLIKGLAWLLGIALLTKGC